jgi:orotate phosphoribosyltransferase
MNPAKENLAASLYQIGVIQFGEFTLKSGQTSSIYINLRKIISYPDILRQVAELMWDAVQQSQFELVCGVPYTALPIATCLSLNHNIPMVMRRKEKKDYGTKQLIEGEFKQEQPCLIIEDVITTGGSIIETATDLQAAGLVITDTVVLIDREQGGRQNLEKHFNVHSILTISEILHALLGSGKVSQNEQQIIEKFIKERVPT